MNDREKKFLLKMIFLVGITRAALCSTLKQGVTFCRKLPDEMLQASCFFLPRGNSWKLSVDVLSFHSKSATIQLEKLKHFSSRN
jgi:hypothetical protein